MFSQILQLFPRSEFELVVRETKAERHARGLAGRRRLIEQIWEQTVGKSEDFLGQQNRDLDCYEKFSIPYSDESTAENAGRKLKKLITSGR
ncbi:MAG TPA: hypothetical protein VH851_07860 [Candidatus Binatia bacterium]|jgi:hypothetical protein